MQQGLSRNWKQFTLLVIINAFVGGMVGLERSILPEFAEVQFGLVESSVVFSFIIVFGFTKAISNYYAGAFANKVGRKRLLVIGWLFALPIPFILLFAPSWSWIVFANVLLGINQGLSWSSTVVMKIDLVGPKQRGLAMGLNESAGYLAVGGVAFLTAWIASEYGIYPYPFYVGIFLSGIGIILSYFFVHDTKSLVQKENGTMLLQPMNKWKTFLQTTFLNRNLSSITQAGMINNLNDGIVWGVLPVLLAGKGYQIQEIGGIVAIYPMVWGIGQALTGKLADLFSKKWLLGIGMIMQGIALFGLIYANQIIEFSFISVVLGLGTAIVYPTFLAGISDYTSPNMRAESIGIFRLWRDSGYALGAIITMLLIGGFGVTTILLFISVLTLLSGMVLMFRMRES